MPIDPIALELENRFHLDGSPTLARAYALLRDAWASGQRDRDLALHLFFLGWYCIVEPGNLTGAEDDPVELADFAAIANEVHDWLLPDGDGSDDVEALYVVSTAARMFSWRSATNDCGTRGVFATARAT